MSKRRILQVQDLIQRELAKILTKDIELPVGSFLNIIWVEVSGDLRHAKVWFGVLPAEKREAVLAVLEKNIGEIQRTLIKRLEMKYVPRLKFEVDTTIDQVEKVDQLVKKINAEKDLNGDE